MKPTDHSLPKAALAALMLLLAAGGAQAATPVITGAGPADPINDTETSRPFESVRVTDADSNPVTVEITFPAARGAFPTTASFTRSGDTYSLAVGSVSNATFVVTNLVFTPTENRIPIGTNEITTFTIIVTDTNDFAVTNVASTLEVTPVNDRPTIAGAAATAEITDKNTVLPFPSVTIADVDNNGAQPVALTITIADILKGNFVGGTLGSFSPLVTSNNYEFTGTPAQAQTAIRGLRYVPNENRIPAGQKETNTFTILVADDGVPSLAVTNTATRVPVISTNDLPSVAGVPTATQPVRTGRTTAAFGSLIVTDPDVNINPARVGQSISVQVTLSAVSLADSALQNGGGFSGSSFLVTDLTPAEATLAAQGLNFRARTSALPPATTNIVNATIVITDDAGGSRTIGPITFAEYTPFTPPGLGGTVADQRVNDTATIAPFSAVSIQSFNAGTFAVLVEIDDAKGQVINLSGFVKSLVGPRARYRFDGTSEAATLAIRQLLFRPTANRLDGDETETVVFDITLLDGGVTVGPDSGTTVIVSPVNDRPTIAGISPLIRINDNQTTQPFSSIGIADVDELGAQLVRITVAPDSADKGFFTTNSLALSGFISNGGAYRLTNTPVAVSAALRLLVFDPTDNLVPIGLATNTVFTITADDGHGGITANSDTVVRSASVAGAPVITVPAQQPVERPFTPPILAFDGVTISDADDLLVTVALANPAQGTFTTNSLAASGFSSAGGGAYTFQGAAAAATAAIIQLDFAPATNLVSSLVSFTISAADTTSNLTSATLTMQLLVVQRSLIVTKTGDYAVGETDPALILGTLRKAVGEAGSGDHITFDIRPETNGLPAYPATIRLRRTLVLLKDVILDGPGADQLTISGDTDGDGAPDVQLFEIHSTTEMHRLTLTKGRAGFAGGAAAVKTGGCLRLSYCAVTDSTADQWGGGIDIEGGCLWVDHSLIHSNSTSSALGQGGGGISIYSGMNCLIENTTFSANRQQSAGGLGGGALYVENLDPGSALTVDVSGCTFKGNTDEADGGTSIRPNVFGSEVRLRNTILADGQGKNLDTDQSGLILSAGGNISDDLTRTIFSFGGASVAVTNLSQPTDQISTDAKLLALAGNNGPMLTHAEDAASPAGSRAVTGGPGTDQRGFWRDAAPDSGAFESNAFRRVVINEIQFAPVGNTNDEFIEFYVPRYAGSLNLSGFTVFVGGVLRHTFTSQALLQGQAIVLLGLDATSTVPVSATGPFMQRSAQNLQINDNGDTITLRNPAGQIVFEASFVAAYTSSDPLDLGSLEPGQSVTLYPEFTGVFLPHRRVEKIVTGIASSAASSPGRDAVGTPIGSGNAPPIAIDDYSSTDEDTALNISALANDLEFDRLDFIQVVSIVSPSVRGALVTINNSPTAGAGVTYDPRGSTQLQSLPEGSSAVDTFTYSIRDCCDPGSGTNWPATGIKYTATNYVTVLGVNDAPTPGLDSVTTSPALQTREDLELDINVVADLLPNDTDPDTDDDNTTLSIGAVHTTGAYEATFTAFSRLGALVTLDLRFNRNETRILYDPAGSAILNALSQGEVTNDTFYYSLVDSHGAIGSAQVQIQVTGTNDTPTAQTDLASTDEDTLLQLPILSLTGNDTDADTDDNLSTAVTLQITALNDNTSLSTTSALGAAVMVLGTNVVYDPTISSNLNALARKEVIVDSFTYTASDGQGGSSTATVLVTVTGVNDQPVAATDALTANEDVPVSVPVPGVLANDTDFDVNGAAPDDVLRVIPAVGLTAQGAAFASAANGGFSFEPRGVFDYLGVGQTTNDSFTYRVVDDSYTVANDDQFSVLADSASVTLVVLANDVTLTGTGGSLQITGVSAPDQGGTVTGNGVNTALIYSPAINFVGVETFQYAIADGQGGRDTATVRVTVTVPVLNGLLAVNTDKFTVARGTTANLDVLANDNTLPANGGTLTITALGAADQGGAAAINGGGPNNSITYTPAPNTPPAFPYTETLNYTVSGGGLTLATGAVLITVVDRMGFLPLNDDVFTVVAGASTHSLDVLFNDRVVPGTVTNLTITSIQTNGVSGVVAINAARTRLLYTPPVGANSHVESVFSYAFTDGSGGTATGLVMVTVMQFGLNANDDFFTVSRGGTNTLLVLTNDNALPNVGQNLLITAIGLGSNAPNRGGQVSIAANGRSLIYAPSPMNATGEETFAYEISDGSLARDQGRVKLKILNRQDAVSVNPDAFSVARGSVNNTLRVLANDNVQPDTRERLTIIAVSSPSRGGSARIAGTSPNQVLLYDAPAGFVGDDTFTYSVADNRGGTAKTNVLVRVGYLATRDDLFTVLSESGSNALDVLANDTLLPNGTVGRPLIAVGSTDHGGSVQTNAAGTRVLYSPAPGFIGRESFTYQVADDTGNLVLGQATVAVLRAGADRATGTVAITIVGTNDPPTIAGTAAGQPMTDKQTLAPFAAVTIGEVDEYGLQNLFVTVSLDSAVKGVLTDLGPFTVSNASTYFFLGTADEATAAIRALVFDPTENRIPVPTNETTRFTIRVNDSYVTVANDSTTVIVTAVNDPPTIAGTVAGQTLYHRLTIRPFASATVAEVDDLTLQPLRIRVALDRATNGYLTSLGGFIASTGGVYTLTNVTAAQATVALRALVFVPTTGSRVGPNLAETTRFTLSVEDGFAAPVIDTNTTVVARNGFVRRLLASDGSDEDEFGYAVSTTRDLMAVGAPFDDPTGSASGSVYLYARHAGGTDQWGEIKKFTASDGAAGDRFGYAVGLSGDTLIVGAPEDTHLGVHSGSVYIFERDQGGADQWGLVKKIVASDRADEDDFGQAVSINGDTLVIGAPEDNHNGDDSGSAYVFQRDQGGPNNWGQVKKLFPLDGDDGDEFGFSVGISAGTIVVGARYDNDRGDDSGSAYVFDRHQGGTNQWGQVRKLRASDGSDDDEFGRAVAISGDMILIGAPHDVDDGDDAGSAYVFVRHQGGTNQWGQAHAFVPFDANDDDEFGFSVAIDGELMVVGSRKDDDNGSRSGSAYVYARNHPGLAQWSLVEKIVPPGAEAYAEFGYAVAIHQNTVAIGARHDDAAGDRFGSTYVYRLNFNNGPIVTLPIADQIAAINNPFTFTLPASTFVDRDGGDALTLAATLAGPAPLPSWLAFNAGAGSFAGTPTTALVYTIEVTATDVDGASVSDTFQLTIAATLPASATALQAWRSANFGPAASSNSGLESTVWGDDADPDLDGFINLFEYMAGTDPLSLTTGAEVLQIATATAPGRISIQFQRRVNDPAYTLALESSLAITPWVPAAAVILDEVASPTVPGIERVTLTIDMGLPSAPHQFFRLKLQH